MRHAIRKAGLTPMKVGRVSSATRHCQPGSGQVGSPSSITIDERTRSAATSAFHIIHEVVREPEQAAARLQIPAERVRLEVLEQDAAVPVHDRLRRPVVPDENSTNSGWSKATGSNSSGPGSASSSSQESASGTACSPYGTCTTCRRRGQRGADRRDLVAAVDRAVAEAVAADRQQHGRLELREAVDDAARAELGRAARPDRAEARRRRERHQRLGDVRQVRRRRGRPGRRRAARGRRAHAPPARGTPRT